MGPPPPPCLNYFLCAYESGTYSLYREGRQLLMFMLPDFTAVDIWAVFFQFFLSPFLDTV